MKKPLKHTIFIRFRAPPQYFKWLHELADLEERTASEWLRRQIKIAAQCANLDGVLTHEQKDGAMIIKKRKRPRKPRQVNDDPALSKDAIILSKTDQKIKMERLSKGLDVNLGAL